MRILGISPTHDSSVAIVNDGYIEYFCKEERLSRSKRDARPFLSIDNAIKYAKGKIDYVVISSPTKNDTFNNHLEHYIRKKLKLSCFRMCDHHHLTHASLAHHNSGFDETLVVVIDRNGSHHERLRESETIFLANKIGYKPLYKSFWLEKIGIYEDSLNYEKVKEITKDFVDCDVVADSTMNITKVYETATTLIGQPPLENGKTMGLSAYGKNQKFKSLFVDDVPNTNLFVSKNTFSEPVIMKDHLDKQITNVPVDNYNFYADYAYQVQYQTMTQVEKLIRKYLQKTGIKKVCLTGGYGLNVVTNEHLVKTFPDIEFYFEPLADDSGNSLGAALYVYKDKTGDKKVSKLKHTFFNNVKHDIPIKGIPTTIKQIAKYLSEGKIVAVFNGHAEAGPRALGNRSILFDSRNPNAKQIVNSVKKREWYRPFAGSILVEHMKDYFNTYHLTESPFMTISFQVKEDKKKVIPGVIHVDNSCRVQSVNKDIPHFYNLLNEFNRITNVPVLLNTSFNMAGESLVETFEDAINTFNKTKIDIIWFPEKQMMIKK